MSKIVEIQVEKKSGLILNYESIPYQIRRAITGRNRAIYGEQNSDGKWVKNRLINEDYLNPEIAVVKYLKDRTAGAKKVVAVASNESELIKALRAKIAAQDELIALLS